VGTWDQPIVEGFAWIVRLCAVVPDGNSVRVGRITQVERRTPFTRRSEEDRARPATLRAWRWGKELAETKIPAVSQSGGVPTMKGPLVRDDPLESDSTSKGCTRSLGILWARSRPPGPALSRGDADARAHVCSPGCGVLVCHAPGAHRARRRETRSAEPGTRAGSSRPRGTRSWRVSTATMRLRWMEICYANRLQLNRG
jgi:hypothetical protein